MISKTWYSPVRASNLGSSPALVRHLVRILTLSPTEACFFYLRITQAVAAIKIVQISKLWQIIHTLFRFFIKLMYTNVWIIFVGNSDAEPIFYLPLRWNADVNETVETVAAIKIVKFSFYW